MKSEHKKGILIGFVNFSTGLGSDITPRIRKMVSDTISQKLEESKFFEKTEFSFINLVIANLVKDSDEVILGRLNKKDKELPASLRIDAKEAISEAETKGIFGVSRYLYFQCLKIIQAAAVKYKIEYNKQIFESQPDWQKLYNETKWPTKEEIASQAAEFAKLLRNKVNH